VACCTVARVAVPIATRPGEQVAPLPWGVGCHVGGGAYIKGGRYRLFLMSSLIPAKEALAILCAAGVNAQKSPARGRCRTLCYLVAGQYVNLGRLRELAREALAAQAEPAPVVAEPEAAPAAPRRPVLPGEPQPVAAPAADAAPVVLPGENREAVATLRANAAAGHRVSQASPAPELPELPTRFAGGGFAGLQPWGNMPGYPQPGANPTAGTPAMG